MVRFLKHNAHTQRDEKRGIVKVNNIATVIVGHGLSNDSFLNSKTDDMIIGRKRMSEDESLWKKLYFDRWRDMKLGPQVTPTTSLFCLEDVSYVTYHNGKYQASAQGHANSLQLESQELSENSRDASEDSEEANEDVGSSISLSGEGSFRLGSELVGTSGPSSPQNIRNISYCRYISSGCIIPFTNLSHHLCVISLPNGEGEGSEEEADYAEQERKKRGKKDWKYSYIRR